MSNVRLTDRVKQAEAYARKNKGKLPRIKELTLLNPGLVQAIYRCPDAFRHIPREFVRCSKHSTSGHVPEAEKIAAENGGVLPCYTDLNNINPSLAHFVMRRQDLFAHIPKAKYTKRRAKAIAKAVKRAEALAAKNGGKLLISQKFQAKYPTLTMVIRRNPEEFAHIPRLRRVTKTIEEHVADAEMLAADNGGKLPPYCVLRDQHGALRTAMTKHPEYFLHLRSEILVTKLEEHVEIARSLAKRNKGVLPCNCWLRSNGFRNLEYALYRKPEAFKGIKQEVRNSRHELTEIRTY